MGWFTKDSDDEQWSDTDADELRSERAWRQRGLAGGTHPVKDMWRISDEVREIDAELRRRGERAW